MTEHQLQEARRIIASNAGKARVAKYGSVGMAKIAKERWAKMTPAQISAHMKKVRAGGKAVDNQ